MVTHKKEEILEGPWIIRRFRQHRERVSNMVHAIDSSPPPQWTHVNFKLKLKQSETERCSRINRDNVILMQRMIDIMRGNAITDAGQNRTTSPHIKKGPWMRPLSAPRLMEPRLKMLTLPLEGTSEDCKRCRTRKTIEKPLSPLLKSRPKSGVRGRPNLFNLSSRDRKISPESSSEDEDLTSRVLLNTESVKVTLRVKQDPPPDDDRLGPAATTTTEVVSASTEGGDEERGNKTQRRRRPQSAHLDSASIHKDDVATMLSCIEEEDEDVSPANSSRN